VTGGTVRPVQLRYPTLPEAAVLAADINAIDAWFTDAHGAADWRRAVSGLLAEEIRLELAEPADPPRGSSGNGPANPTQDGSRA